MRGRLSITRGWHPPWPAVTHMRWLWGQMRAAGRPWPTRFLVAVVHAIDHFLSFYIIPIHPARWSCLFAVLGFYAKVIWGPSVCRVCGCATGAPPPAVCPRESCVLAWLDEQARDEGAV